MSALPHTADAQDCAAEESEERGQWLARRRVALHTIRSLVEFWRIQPDELEGDHVPPPPPAPVVRPVKYRHPVSAETWDGEGAQPEWLRQALLKQGYTVAELRSAAQAAPLQPQDQDEPPRPS